MHITYITYITWGARQDRGLHLRQDWFFQIIPGGVWVCVAHPTRRGGKKTVITVTIWLFNIAMENHIF